MVAKRKNKDLLIDGDAPEQDEEPIMVPESNDNTSLEDEVDQGPNASGDAVPSTGKLEEDANQAVGAYLKEHGIEIFKGVNLSDDALEILAIFGPSMFSTRPIKGTNFSCFSYELSKEPNPGIIRTALVKLLGDFVKEVDFYKDEKTVKDITKLAELIPEMEEISKIPDKKYQRTLHRYSLVLSLENKYQSLPTMALANRPNTGSDNHLYKTKDRETDLGKLKEICMPTLREVMVVAQTYDVKEIMPVMETLKSKLGEYEQVWRGS